MRNARANKRREARCEMREARGERPSAARSDVRSGRAERERGDAKGNERRAKCARREEREAREGRLQRVGEGRAARAGTEKSCAQRP